MKSYIHEKAVNEQKMEKMLADKIEEHYCKKQVYSMQCLYNDIEYVYNHIMFHARECFYEQLEFVQESTQV